MSLLSVRCKLIPDASTAEKLTRTVNQFANACNYTLQVARRDNLWNKFALQRAVYRELRERFGLSANLAVRAIARVGKRKGHKVGGFKATSVDYDQRILSVNLDTEVVSLSTVDGRVKVPMQIAGYQRHLLRTAKSIQGGQLVRGRDSWYVHLWCEYDDPPAMTPNGFLGVDLGIVNIATDSDGETYSGSHLNSVRHRHRRLRRKLQKKGTKGAKRRLKKLSGKEARFSNHTNHALSKRIVAKAQRTGRGIAIEDLGGIRDRVRLRRPQRAALHSWAFFDLGQKLRYKAERAGVVLVQVDPRNTSRTCPACGHCEKLNRVSQAQFVCRSCGLVGHADHFAAVNIAVRGWAAVNRPYLGEAESAIRHNPVPGSPRL
ncbi:transposase, IS605 OrfB family [Allomeiothermus silvanus DSM 9946]|uniref:Transposase, IS605 OrfB family n=1 Tax=Allomeiothermus silvanus (strain ATCC 700542 / DSM 9946 / NBRC 106475 / NCIMB 13440 / VI-R2) TaxID=526227 RepID=D7BDA3_ALLS1|nr:RNA-guided endonuclease TnpB family protein [Allomeiothermus silvanus]ADH63021.1 transposase, IS605 OrfB family [Allomeiothermus silvanus DSM 9946]ADH63098.1 transposase, IS605 OrfB family [Allomeiothermus silvanus DSM 9946]